MTRRRGGTGVATFARFLTVGVTNTGISFLVFVVALHILPATGARVLTAQFLSYGAGLAWSYAWNRRWAFGSTAAVGAEAGRFVVSQVALMVGSALSLAAVVERLHVDPRLAWVGVMAVVTLLNFMVLQAWVFQAPAGGRRS